MDRRGAPRISERASQSEDEGSSSGRPVLHSVVDRMMISRRICVYICILYLVDPQNNLMSKTTSSGTPIGLLDLKVSTTTITTRCLVGLSVPR